VSALASAAVAAELTPLTGACATLDSWSKGFEAMDMSDLRTAGIMN
jgi:hypothetical protein